MRIPAKVQITYRVKAGTIFYFVEDSFDSEEPHYFVVLNVDPKSGEILVLVNATSQELKAKMRRIGMPPETLVTVRPDECGELKKTSVFDCNRPTEKTKAILIEMLDNGQLQFRGSMPEEIVEKLRSGLIASPMVPELCKKRMRGEII